MKNKKLLSFLLIAVLVFSLAALVACGKKETPPAPTTGTEPTPATEVTVLYELPADFAFSVDVYNVREKIGTLEKADLAKVSQELKEKDDKGGKTNYVAYNLKALMNAKGIAVPESVKTIDSYASDGYTKFEKVESIDNAYIAVGKEVEKDGVKSFETGNKFYADIEGEGKANKNIAEIYLNATEFTVDVKGNKFVVGQETLTKLIKGLGDDYEEVTLHYFGRGGNRDDQYKGASIENIIKNPGAKTLKSAFKEVADSDKIKLENADATYKIEEEYKKEDLGSLYIVVEQGKKDGSGYEDIEKTITIIDIRSTYEASVKPMKMIKALLVTATDTTDAA